MARTYGTAPHPRSSSRSSFLLQCLLSFYYFTPSDHKYKQAVGERKQAYQFIHVIFFFLSFQVIRLESQVSRYKQAAENAEKIEDELKAEKRKLQRELRSALDKTEELEVSNGHLVKRLEKMKANRSVLLSQQ